MGCQAALWWFALSRCYGLNGVAKAPSDWGFFMHDVTVYGIGGAILAMPA